MPFGREELISFSDTDFAYRALVSTTIPPARDKGVMVNGRFLRRGLTYEVGMFDDDGDNGRLTEPQFAVGGDPEDIGPSFAGRVTGTPFRPLSERFETFRLGFAYGLADVPEGLNSLRGQTAHGTDDFFEPVYVKGRRQRVGVEASFTPGPVGFAAEWMQAREEREGQGLGDVDLSDFITTGWYANATWFITGEDKRTSTILAIRCSAAASAPSRSPRATRSSSSKAKTRPDRRFAILGRSTSCRTATAPGRSG